MRFLRYDQDRQTQTDRQQLVTILRPHFLYPYIILTFCTVTIEELEIPQLKWLMHSTVECLKLTKALTKHKTQEAPDGPKFAKAKLLWPRPTNDW